MSLTSIYNSPLANYNGQTMTKVQLTLTEQEVAILRGVGSLYGYNLPRTLKFIISKEVNRALQERVIPTYKMSKKMEKVALQAEKDYREGKTFPMDDIDKFFDEL